MNWTTIGYAALGAFLSSSAILLLYYWILFGRKPKDKPQEPKPPPSWPEFIEEHELISHFAMSYYWIRRSDPRPRIECIKKPAGAISPVFGDVMDAIEWATAKCDPSKPWYRFPL